ncbi:MAG TPA: fumarylacetoacetase [Clostridia bacterium]|nr:fumarylacetoacetase [Clostridia bacterium]
MIYDINETHDPYIQSWVESANISGTDFPLQNLPFGVFLSGNSKGRPRVGVAIGNQVLDMSAAEIEGLFLGEASTAAGACASETLNDLMALGRRHWSALRRRLHQLLRADAPAGDRQRVQRHLVPMHEVEMLVPARIGDYTDFYASVYHATNVGTMFRPDNPLLPNYKYVPIGYHGRASSIVVSGTPVRRPKGQTRDDAAKPPVFGPSKRLDYEAEIGAFVGPANDLGDPVPLGAAESHLFGLCVVNDWSARDIQTWEYQPLGPFLAKNFATTTSPWVVTMEALAPFRTSAFRRFDGDPAPLPYLANDDDQRNGGVDLFLEVYLSSEQMRERDFEPMRLSRGNFRDMYWTLAQMLAHHTSTGCNLRPGDLLASGTVSGNTSGSRGCLLELTWRGSEALQLPTGETRQFLKDGDEVTMHAYCEREGCTRIGFGECTGVIIG